jgi:hypothetical protein
LVIFPLKIQPIYSKSCSTAWRSHLPGDKPGPDAAARPFTAIHLFRLFHQVEDQVTSRASGQISSVLAPNWIHFVILSATCFVRAARRWAAAVPPSRERLAAL